MKVKFSECVAYMIKGPFGSDMKKSLYVPKGKDTYKVYVQGNAIQKDENLGDYYVSSEYFHKKLERFQVHPGDYIITCDGTLGKYIKLSENVEPGVISSSLLLLRLDESKIYDKFFELIWDNSMLKYLASQARNACLVHLPSAKAIGDVEIDLPEMSVQREIADKAFLIKDIVNKRNEEMRLLDELIKARFVELFGSINEDKFPKCTLREVAHIKHGFAFSGEFFSEEANGVVLVTPGNFALGGGFQEVRNKYFTSDYPEEYILHAGDLIVTMTDLSKKADTLGYGAIVPDTGKVYLHNQRIGLFDQLDERLNPVFVRWYMQTEEYRLEIVRTSTGSTVHHTSPDRILDSVIYLPPVELQNSFVIFANQVDKSKVAVQKALNEAQLLFDSLMQKYFG